MKRFILVLMSGLLLLGSFSSIQATQNSSAISTSSWVEVLEYAKVNLPMEGKLLAKPEGFGYLKVDDNYIHALFPMLGLEEEGYKKPGNFRSPEAPGAHISIFYVSDNIWPEELGQTFHFTLKQITMVKTKEASWCVLQVESPELENLRAKYGLSPKLFGHEYHISLAKKAVKK